MGGSPAPQVHPQPQPQPVAVPQFGTAYRNPFQSGKAGAPQLPAFTMSPAIMPTSATSPFAAAAARPQLSDIDRSVVDPNQAAQQEKAGITTARQGDSLARLERIDQLIRELSPIESPLNRERDLIWFA